MDDLNLSAGRPEWPPRCCKDGLEIPGWNPGPGYVGMVLSNSVEIPRSRRKQAEALISLSLLLDLSKRLSLVLKQMMFSLLSLKQIFVTF